MPFLTQTFSLTYVSFGNDGDAGISGTLIKHWRKMRPGSQALALLCSATDYVRLLLRTLEKPWNYRGRAVSAADIVFIRELIAAGPEIGRCSLSRLLCEAWGWKQPNGVLCDMICRGLLLRLDRAGEIQLPAVRFRPARNPLADRRRPEPVVPDTRPVCGPWGLAR